VGIRGRCLSGGNYFVLENSRYGPGKSDMALKQAPPMFGAVQV